MKAILVSGLYLVVAFFLGRLCASYLGLFRDSGFILLFIGGLGLVLIALLSVAMSMGILITLFKHPLHKLIFLKEVQTACGIWAMTVLMLLGTDNANTVQTIVGGNEGRHIAGILAVIISSLAAPSIMKDQILRGQV